jgi:cytochrome c
MIVPRYVATAILFASVQAITYAASSTDNKVSPPGNVARGESTYALCQSCHSLDENDVGPRHRGVFGRRAGAVDDYAYSPALKASGIVWTTTTLDRWLDNPQALVPGAKMFFALKNAQDRADVIAYLTLQH